MRIEIGEYIVMDDQVCHGKPVFKGTRILVSDILELIASGLSFDELMKEYPSLTREMIYDALKYAARLIKGERYVGFNKVYTR